MACGVVELISIFDLPTRCVSFFLRLDLFNGATITSSNSTLKFYAEKEYLFLHISEEFMA